MRFLTSKLHAYTLGAFLNMDRKPLYGGQDRMTKGFTKSFKYLHFCWILGAGHLVLPPEIFYYLFLYKKFIY